MKTPPIKPLAMLVATLLMTLPATAQAFCMYHDVMYAKTTVPQEFHDSEWVAKVRVLSGTTHLSDVEASYSIYKLKVLEVYKGKPPATLRFLSYRNSGGFYFELPDTGVDTGGEYLVFLYRPKRTAGEPAAVEGSVFVNYPCGHSKRWEKVTAKERAELKALSRK